MRTALTLTLLAAAGLGAFALATAASHASGAPTVNPTDTKTAAAPSEATPAYWEKSPTDATKKVERTDDDWKKLLDPQAYNVMREKGTERAFSGKYWNNHEHGVYRCAACGLEVFSSDTKFESGTGWPSYWQPITPDRIGTQRDFSWGMFRTEVHCARCGSHLGHVFDDGPQPTGLRYCLNSVSLVFEKR